MVFLLVCQWGSGVESHKVIEDVIFGLLRLKIDYCCLGFGLQLLGLRDILGVGLNPLTIYLLEILDEVFSCDIGGDFVYR